MIFGAEVVKLAQAVRSTGAKLPPRFAQFLELDNTLAQATSMDPSRDPLLSALKEDPDLTGVDVVQLVMDTAESRVRATQARDVAVAVFEHLAARFEESLRDGPVGVELIEAVRPIFDRAAAGLAEANQYLSPDDTAESILSRPDADEAVKAWQTIGTHRAVLARIFAAVVVPLVRDFDSVGWRDYSPAVATKATAFVIAGEHPGDLPVAQSLLGYGDRPHTNRGGGWHKLIRAGWRLRLNTPAEARAICDAYDESLDREPQERARESWYEPASQ